MRLGDVLITFGLARSKGEAARFAKQGAVSVGGCNPDCTWFTTGRCACGGWEKVTDVRAELEPGLAVKVGSGNWRCMTRDNQGKPGPVYDQVPGVARVPYAWDATELLLCELSRMEIMLLTGREEPARMAA